MTDDNPQSPATDAPAASPEPDTSAATSSALAQFGAPETLAASAAQLAANTVEVDPGGATFTSIGAALASITDNSQQKQYLLYVGPGTYNERVTLKPYVYLHGAGQGQTIINYPPAQEAFQRGTVIAASNSGIAGMTVNCLGGSWGVWSTALIVAGANPFMASDVGFVSDDQGNAGVNSETVAVNWNAEGSGQQAVVYFSYCAITSNMQSNQSVAVGIIVNGPANATLQECKVVGQGGMQSFGVQSNGGAVVTCDNCYAQGATMSLSIPDYNSTLIANNCQTNGPVGSGVQINNTPPSGGGD